MCALLRQLIVVEAAENELTSARAAADVGSLRKASMSMMGTSAIISAVLLRKKSAVVIAGGSAWRQGPRGHACGERNSLRRHHMRVLIATWSRGDMLYTCIHALVEGDAGLSLPVLAFWRLRAPRNDVFRRSPSRANLHKMASGSSSRMRGQVPMCCSTEQDFKVSERLRCDAALSGVPRG